MNNNAYAYTLWTSLWKTRQEWLILRMHLAWGHHGFWLCRCCLSFCFSFWVYLLLCRFIFKVELEPILITCILMKCLFSSHECKFGEYIFTIIVFMLNLVANFRSIQKTGILLKEPSNEHSGQVCFKWLWFHKTYSQDILEWYPMLNLSCSGGHLGFPIHIKTKLKKL